MKVSFNIQFFLLTSFRPHTHHHSLLNSSLSLSLLLLSLSSTPPPFTVCTPHFPAVFVVCVSFIVGVWFLGVPLCEGAARAYSMTAFFGLSFVAFYSLTLPLFLNSFTLTFDRFISKKLLIFIMFWGSLACSKVGSGCMEYFGVFTILVVAELYYCMTGRYGAASHVFV